MPQRAARERGQEKLQGLFADTSFEVVVMLVDTEDTTSCRDFGAKWTAIVNAPVDLFLMNAGEWAAATPRTSCNPREARESLP